MSKKRHAAEKVVNEQRQVTVEPKISETSMDSTAADYKGDILTIPGVGQIRTALMEYTEPSIASQVCAFDEIFQGAR